MLCIHHFHLEENYDKELTYNERIVELMDTLPDRSQCDFFRLKQYSVIRQLSLTIGDLSYWYTAASITGQSEICTDSGKW
jgi:hypothetical protein